MSSSAPSNTSIASCDTLDSSYVVHYFAFHGLGACARAILALAGAKWEDKFADYANWSQIKASEPWPTLPVLIETTSSGAVTLIPESEAIERYLSRKYGFYGKTLDQDIEIDIYYSQAHVLQTKYIQRVLAAPSPEARIQTLNHFVKELVPSWIDICEKRLQGRNGYFVDGRLTLADIRTAVVLDAILSLGDKSVEEFLNSKASPGLWQLKKNVDQHPGYREYRQGEGYKSSDRRTQFGLSQVIATHDVAKARIFDD